MNIILNGEPLELSQAMNIDIFLQKNGYGDKKVAVAVNGAFVPKSSHAQHELNDGDQIEIVAPMQGG